MNQEILDKVLKSPRLPSLPTIAIEVIELVQKKDVNIKQIAHTISHDPALSSKILKTVNSSFYGQAHTISTISHALVILGLSSVKTLALGFSLVPNLRDSGGAGFDHVDFWKRSLYSAVAARSLSRMFGVVQQEEAFLGGLLQDLGVLAMYQALGTPYAKLSATVGTEHRKLVAAERAAFETDHAEIGAALASAWKLPPLLVEPIRHHEDASNAPPELQELVRCVVLGGRLADVFVSSQTAEALSTYQAMALDWFNVSVEQAENILKGIHSDTMEVKRLFDLPTGDLEHPDQILARANEAMVAISMQRERAATELEQQNRELSEQVYTDSLTGAANRRKFNEFIAEQFDKSRGGDGPLSVLFLDADKFKSFNDTYGHQVGDRVLVELAGVLRKSVTKGGLVARYGGEEFATILPKTARPNAAALAETIRQRIQALTINTDDGKALKITASIGVATYEGQVFVKAEQLVKAADQAVYAAKGAGRNCVRVFIPRVKPAGTPVPAPGVAAAPAQRVA